MASLQRQLADAMNDIYVDTNARNDFLIDIHPICAVWEQAYTHFGAVSFLTDLMKTDDMLKAIVASFADRGLHVDINNERGQEYNVYSGDIEVRGRGYQGRQAMDVHCQGCLFWTRHYAGAFLMKKLEEDGKLLKFGESQPDAVVNNMHEWLQLVRAEMRKTHADYITVSITHGSIWHTVASKFGPDMEDYPLRDAWDWCGELLDHDWNDEHKVSC